MVKKATWILVLLVALVIISVSAAFAAGIAGPAPTVLTPAQEISAAKSHDSFGGTGSYRARGDCPFHQDNAAAY